MFQVKYQKDNFSHWSKHYSITLEKTVSCLQQLLKSFKNNLLKIIYAGYLLQLKLFFKNNTFCQGRPFTYIESSNRVSKRCYAADPFSQYFRLFQEKHAIACRQTHTCTKVFRNVINCTCKSKFWLHVLLHNCLCLIKMCACSHVTITQMALIDY